ncbi:MAG: NAD(P)-dependent oxidoreductase [Armatimonadetes bacterium]|nr:NAD(P)-dependent oxidoreductase [Armatimonadota bacterium]
MKVLVTGAASILGSEFVQRYGDQYDLRLSDTNPSDVLSYSHAQDWWQGELADVSFVQALVQGADAIVHLPSGHGADAWTEAPLQERMLMTNNVFQAAREAFVKRVVTVACTQSPPVAKLEMMPPPNISRELPGLKRAFGSWTEALCSVYSGKGIQCAAIRMEPEAHSLASCAEIIHNTLQAEDFKLRILQPDPYNTEAFVDVIRLEPDLPQEAAGHARGF